MVLTIEMAQRLSKQQLKEIQSLEQEINDDQSITDVKALLSKIEKEIAEFKDFTINQKSFTFEKEKNNFNLEAVYPYLQTDFYS